VKISIDRTQPSNRLDNGHIFFVGRDEEGAALTVELDRSAWETIQAEWSFDPLAGVEELARHGHWRMHDGQPVWRIDFI